MEKFRIKFQNIIAAAAIAAGTGGCSRQDFFKTETLLTKNGVIMREVPIDVPDTLASRLHDIIAENMVPEITLSRQPLNPEEVNTIVSNILMNQSDAIFQITTDGKPDLDFWTSIKLEDNRSKYLFRHAPLGMEFPKKVFDLLNQLGIREKDFIVVTITERIVNINTNGQKLVTYYGIIPGGVTLPNILIDPKLCKDQELGKFLTTLLLRTTGGMHYTYLRNERK